MRSKICFTIFLTLLMIKSFGQESPNMSAFSANSANTTASNNIANIPVDLFRGLPSLSVPIFDYSKDNFRMSVGATYQGGGVKLYQYSSNIGLGWYLQAGGTITRSVRGVPDDLPSGFINNLSPISNDLRTQGDKLYNDSLDAEQDLFNFNFCGRGGQFYIGKDKIVTTLPLSNLKVIPSFHNGLINSFKIIAEDGTKYIFSTEELSQIYSPMPSGYYGQNYTTSWALSKILFPFNTDSITFNYSTEAKSIQFAYPQVGYYNSLGNQVTNASYATFGTSSSEILKISRINFPGNIKLNFYYDYIKGNIAGNLTVKRIELSDTIFRRGFVFSYDETMYGSADYQYRLKTVTPYFQDESARSYNFYYDTVFNSSAQPVGNARDHWGYYNGASNLTMLPSSLPGSVDRTANLAKAQANIIRAAFVPGMGHVSYTYELNDRFSYSHSIGTIMVNAPTSSNNPISLHQIFNDRHHLTFGYSNLIARMGALPAPSSAVLQCSIKSADLLTTYATANINVDSLFLAGSLAWEFNVPNGDYRLLTQFAGGSITGAFPVAIKWENKHPDGIQNFMELGGLRVKSVKVQSAENDANGLVTTYRYVREDGRSSGFLGDVPNRTYPYLETNPAGTNLTYSTIYSSEPLEGIPGEEFTPAYSRVEAMNGTVGFNSGKTVYEFTDLKDVNANQFHLKDPFTFDQLKEWGLGSPKKITLYDSAGRKVQTTVNNYTFHPFSPSLAMNQSIKLQRVGNIKNGSTNKYVYNGSLYSFSTGRIMLANTIDSTFFENGSLKVSTVAYTYDTPYYNIKTVTSGYNKGLGLQSQKRFYYPYNYTVGGTIGKLRDSSITAAPVSTEEWIIGDGNPRLLNANVTDFQQLPTGHIRPLTNYMLLTNMPLPEATIGAFNPAQLIRNSTYFKPVTTYNSFDNKGNLLQGTNNITGEKSSTIMDYGQSYPVATVSNAAHTDIAYTGFESDGTGSWTISGTPRDSTTSMTGKRSYNLAAGAISKTGLNSVHTYILTAWVKNAGRFGPANAITVNGNLLATLLITKRGIMGDLWGLYTIRLSGISNISITGTGIIDELRFYPSDAYMASSTYEPNVGVTSSNDVNNTLSYFDYDNLFRQFVVRDMDKNIVKKSTYSDVKYYIPGQVGAGGPGTYTGPGTKTIVCFEGPQFKKINGICEIAIRQNISTTYTGTDWECTYRWVWSDSSESIIYTENNADPCL